MSAPPSDPKPLLAVRGLCKRYGDTQALDGVDLEVAPGEVLGLLGPNGAGKTTLIRIVMDIIRADAGAVRLFGAPLSRSALDRVGYLPEERGLYTKARVVEVLTYFGRLKGLGRREARQRAEHWLERVGLAHTARQRVEQMSKGMGQKLQLAATLLTDPELSILDEPFSGLDPINLRMVRELIRERRRAGRATILSTHQMSEVEGLCDRVALVHRGRRVVYGSVAEVRQRYSKPEVMVDMPGELPELSGVRARHADGDHPKRWLLELGPEHTPGSVLAELVAAGVVVERFEPVVARLEDIFVRVVGEADAPGDAAASGGRAA